MEITELFNDFTYKPGDLVQLKVQAAGMERLEAFQAKYEREAETTVSRTGFSPRYTPISSGPFPTVFQIASRNIMETFGGVIETLYNIEGDNGQKLIVHEDELVALPPTPNVDTGTNT